jgi:ketosteroid isomerase-like protein
MGDPISNLAVADRIMAAFFSGDSEEIRALVAEDFVLEPSRDALHHDVYRGSDGFLRFMEKFAAVYDLKESHRANVYAAMEGEALTFELHLRGTVRGSGNAFDTSLLEIWDFRDGKLCRIVPHWFDLPK